MKDLYERVFSGESVEIEYSTIVKKVFAEDTKMSSHCDANYQTANEI